MFVKICGLTNLEDALLAVALDADALGFIFVPGSVRQTTPDQVRDIVRRLPHGTVTVGVFRDEAPQRVIEVVNSVGLTGAQLHGREPVSEVRRIRKQVQFVVQGFTAGDPAVATAANGPADVVLIDSPDPGSGRVFDWSLAEGAPGGLRLMIAGGLTPDNVGEAIARVRPWGVDVATGVEATPGRKDPRKVRRFIEVARAAGERLADRPVDAASGEAGEDELREPRGVPADTTPPYDWEIDELGA